METKLCVSLCALLLLGFGSADHGLDHSVSHPSTTAPGAGAGANQTDAPVPHNDAKDVNQKNTTANPAAVTPPEQEVKGAVTHHDLMTNPTGSDANGQQTVTLAPPVVTTTISSTESHSSNSTSGPLKLNITSSSFDSVVTSDPHNKTHVPTTVPPPKSTSASNSNPSTTNVINSSQPITNILSTTQAHITAPTKPASVTTTRTEVHTDTPSNLNVKGDTTKDSVSPPLDPLLAGLVSAFIITAVIITLLLFLKLRRRDTRPEFRRLQDLPMDDMEDTPLSMYSY